MDDSLHDRIEAIEDLLREALKVLGEFRREQRVANAQFEKLFVQFGMRLDRVENRVTSVEESLRALTERVENLEYSAFGPPDEDWERDGV